MSALESTFRAASPTLVATLTRAFGPARLDLVEAVVQEAFVRAMQEWPAAPPSNPGGWLLSVARNLAIDQLRRERSFDAKREDIARLIEATASAAASDAFASGSDEVRLAGELADDQLKMIFVACHPSNTLPSQVALALRTLCGLEVAAIARALFASEAAIEKRLVLARKRLREVNLDFELPSADELDRRLDAVLGVLYLMFNEGYASTAGADLIDTEVAFEALRLATFLAGHPSTKRADVDALRALMQFHAARFPARCDPAGRPLGLAEQDRSQWDHQRIDQGLQLLAASARGNLASRYHFEAAIAAVHATSPTFADTRWDEIVRFYDQLLEISPSARLARAVAIGFRDGPQACLDELAELGREPEQLAAYHAARGDALGRLARHADAHAAYEQARALARSVHERRYYESKLTP